MKNRALTAPQAASGQHEVVVHTIQTTLGDLAHSLNPDQVLHLYAKIEKYPFEEYDAKAFYLLRSVCHEAIAASSREGFGIQNIMNRPNEKTEATLRNKR